MTIHEVFKETLPKVTPQSSNPVLPHFSRHPRQIRRICRGNESSPFQISREHVRVTLSRIGKVYNPWPSSSQSFLPNSPSKRLPAAQLELHWPKQTPQLTSHEFDGQGGENIGHSNLFIQSAIIILAAFQSFLHHARFFSQPLLFKARSGIIVSLSFRLRILLQPHSYLITALNLAFPPTVRGRTP